MNFKIFKKWNSVAVMLMFILLICFVQFFCRWQVSLTKKNTIAFLASFEENIQSKLKSEYNYAENLRIAMKSGGDVNKLVEEILSFPESIYIEILDDSKVSQIYSKDTIWQKYTGENIKDLDYAHTLARLTKELVVEGPVMQEGKLVFLIIEPIHEDSKFSGEVVVALDANILLDKCNLEQIVQNEYDYELWRVNPLDGHKEIIKVSSDKVDFSKAIEIKFEMPTIWTLSILPKAGWYNKTLMGIFIVGAIIITLGFAFLLHFYVSKKELEKNISLIGKIDSETGFYNYKSFIDALNTWTQQDTVEFSMIYVVINNYNRITQTNSPEENNKLITYFVNCLNQYVKSEHIIGRLGECNYILAIRENISQTELEYLKMGLSIEMLYKIILNDEPIFLTAECETCQFPKDGTHADELVSILVHKYYKRVYEQSPAHDLSEKCDRIVNGDRSVLFGEYADLDMNRLSKALARCQRKLNVHK